MNKAYTKKYYANINHSLLEFCNTNFTLRPIVNEDLETLFAWRNDPLVNKHLVSPPPKDMHEQRLWFRNYIQDPGCIHFMTMMRRSEDIKVGYCQLLRIDSHKSTAEYGVVIGEKKFIGRGFGLKLIITLVKIAFSFLGFQVLYANINPENKSSKRIVQDFMGATIVNGNHEIYSKRNEELFRIDKEAFDSFEMKLVTKSKKWVDIFNIKQIESCKLEKK